ncbi:SDR family NAD(P)-dependent oxidoreductase [Halalkalibaculum sp. DA3122]|uniref:SDR family NAD(P)-dependent oxidoreductase n=1 Tax=Halalkalibaculum sp. DA3122 TaxID=3373607 RepID=UPI0037548D23
MFTLSQKTAVITGAGKGIGKSIAQLFARQGADVHILDLDEESGQQAAAEINDAGGDAHYYCVNVADQQAVLDAFDQVYDTHNRLNILVNNAGIAHIGTLENTTEEDMDRLLSVNVKGVYNCSLAGVKKMKESGGGAIVNMASIAATLGIPERFAYSTTKGAVLTMTYSIAKDYIGDGIRCNAISPARVHTPFVDGYLEENYPGQEDEMFEKLSKTQPIGRMGKPEEIAGLALYLCSDESAFITGSNYTIDGGFTTLNT